MARPAADLRILLIAAVAAIWLAAPGTALAQRVTVGPGKCTDCHDHKDEKEWSE